MMGRRNRRQSQDDQSSSTVNNDPNDGNNDNDNTATSSNPPQQASSRRQQMAFGSPAGFELRPMSRNARTAATASGGGVNLGSSSSSSSSNQQRQQQQQRQQSESSSRPSSRASESTFATARSRETSPSDADNHNNITDDEASTIQSASDTGYDYDEMHDDHDAQHDDDNDTTPMLRQRTSDFGMLFSPPDMLFSPPSVVFDDNNEDEITNRMHNVHTGVNSRTPAFVHQLRGQSALADFMSPPPPLNISNANNNPTPRNYYYASDSDSDAGSVKEPFADQVKTLDTLLMSPALSLGNLGNMSSTLNNTMNTNATDEDDDLEEELNDQQMSLLTLQQELAHAEQSLLVDSPDFKHSSAAAAAMSPTRSTPSVAARRKLPPTLSPHESKKSRRKLFDTPSPANLRRSLPPKSRSKSPSFYQRRGSDGLLQTHDVSTSSSDDDSKPASKVTPGGTNPKFAEARAIAEKQASSFELTSPQTWIQRLGLRKPAPNAATADASNKDDDNKSSSGGSSSSTSHKTNDFNPSGAFPSGPIIPSPTPRDGVHSSPSSQISRVDEGSGEDEDSDIYDEANVGEKRVNSVSFPKLRRSGSNASADSALSLQRSRTPPTQSNMISPISMNTTNSSFFQSMAKLESTLMTPKTPPVLSRSGSNVSDDIKSTDSSKFFRADSIDSIPFKDEEPPRMPKPSPAAVAAAAAASAVSNTKSHDSPIRPRTRFLPGSSVRSPSRPWSRQSSGKRAANETPGTASPRETPGKAAARKTPDARMPRKTASSTGRSNATDNAVMETPSAMFASLPQASPSSASSDGSSPAMKVVASSLTTGTISSSKSQFQGRQRRPANEQGTWIMNMLSSMRPSASAAAQEDSRPDSPMIVQMDRSSLRGNNGYSDSSSSSRENASQGADDSQQMSEITRSGSTNKNKDKDKYKRQNKNNSSEDDDGETMNFFTPQGTAKQLYPYDIGTQTYSTMSSPPTTMTSPSGATMSSGSIMPLSPPSPPSSKRNLSLIDTKKEDGSYYSEHSKSDGSDPVEFRSKATWKVQQEKRRIRILYCMCMFCMAVIVLAIGLAVGLTQHDSVTSSRGSEPQNPMIVTAQPSNMPTEIPSESPSDTPTLSFSPTISAQPSGRPTISSQPTQTRSPTENPTITPSATPSSQPTSSPTRSDYIVLADYQILITNGRVVDVSPDEYTGDLISAMDLMAAEIFEIVLQSEGLRIGSGRRNLRRLERLERPELVLPTTLVETEPVVVACRQPTVTGRCETWTSRIYVRQSGEEVGSKFEDFIQTNVALGRLQQFLNDVNPDSPVAILDFLIRPTFPPTPAPTRNSTSSPNLLLSDPPAAPGTSPTAAPIAIPQTTPTSTPTISVTVAPPSTPTAAPIAVTVAPQFPPTAAPVVVPPTAPPATSTPTSAPIAPTFSPTSTATTSRIEQLITAASFDGGESLRDTMSPQFKAFQWVLGNANLDDYSDWRIIQRYALASLYYSTDGDGWSVKDRWLSDRDECSWYSKVIIGSVCKRGRFARLDLDFNNLDGTVPVEVALLSHSLVRLDLRGGPNSFLTGSLPTEFGLLTKLEELIFRDNYMTGQIPTQLGELSRLEFVDLSRNDFSGTLPTEIGNWDKLTHLEIAINDLNGKLPSQIGRLREMKHLYIQNNMMTGALPSQIGSLNKLVQLVAGMNEFDAIPTELGNLYNLGILGLEDNSIHGTIPTEVGYLQKLTSLELNNNRLEGTIPYQLGNLYAQLRDRLDLSFNRLSGNIPSELGWLNKLRILALQHNQLTGEIPSEIHELDRLTTFRVESNNLTGEIPNEICQVFTETAPAFYADCAEFQGNCPCCTFCCDDDRVECRCRYDGTPLQYLCYQTMAIVAPEGN